MKKILTSLFFIVSSLFLFAESYKITDYSFDITGAKGLNIGKTNETALLMKCPIDTDTVFNSREELDKYINNYGQQLMNTRAFDTIDLKWELKEKEEGSNINEIKLHFILVDSNHLLALPYPKYDSNTGLNLKIKAKDTNFLGTLNPLSTDLYFNFIDNEDTGEKNSRIGLNFSYDYPFKAGIFDASWDNALTFDYIFGDESPTFRTIIGTGFSLPKKLFSINFGIYQTIGYAKPSKETEKNYFYFQEHFGVNTPVKLYKAANFSTVTYKPYADFMFSWDIKDIVKIQPASPIEDGMSINFGHSIENINVNWDGCFREGYSISLNNDYSYKFDTKFPVGSVSLEGSLFTNFKIMDKCYLDRFGIYSKLYAYSIIEMPERGDQGNISFASRMRGIMDNRLPESPYGFVLNIDMPFNIITTNFPKDLFNFTLQLSPFIDMSLSKNTNSLNFNLSNKELSAGLEVLVYPKKFSSYTIRASIGFDIKRAFKAKNKIRGLLDNKEIYIGLDLHY